MTRRPAAEGVFMEAFHYLFHPVTRRLHEILDSGELGELRHVETWSASRRLPRTTRGGR